MEYSNRPRIIVIVGPTASGKSSLAIHLARIFDGEIISADSRQVYRGMDIGTGKVTKREQRLAPHHLLDVASPRHVFTAHKYQKLGARTLTGVIRRHKTPIIAGGTGFYIDILLGRAISAPVAPQPAIRKKLEAQSTDELYKQLQEQDPQRAARIDRHNKRRLIRALEIILATGRPVPSPSTTPSPYEILWIGIDISKENLEKSIRIRLQQRLHRGMIAEVKRLIANGVTHKRLQALGLEYRAVSQFLQGQISKERMISQLTLDITKYAKRQMTWFRRNKDIHWISPDIKTAERLVRQFLS